MNKDRKDNLMMVAAYYKEVYMDAISDTIDPEKLIELNAGIDEVTEMFKESRIKLHSLEHHGRQHTQGLWSIYQKLDLFVEELQDIKKLVNKQGHRINLEDYPI